PCMASCPAHVDVPGYVSLVKEGKYEEAVALIRKDNPFPSVCGYVCEHPCEKSCRRNMVDDAVNICGIKRFAVDHKSEDLRLRQAEPTGKRIAVVGGGPGGLTAAYYLSLMGHSVTVYEQRDSLGGMLRYGIPDYRLPQDVLDADIRFILDVGIEVKLGTNVGEEIAVEDLKKQYDAVYLSIGAHDDRKLGIEGEDAKNVVPAVSMLREIGEGNKPDLTGKRVCVIGGGNVAMDATRTALRLGAKEVTCVYRRRIADMTALSEEIEEAQAEGGRILTLYAPEYIEKDEAGAVAALWVQPQIIGSIGRDGRPSVSGADAEPARLACDYIVVAIGQSIHSRPFEESGMQTRRGAFTAERSSYVPGSGNVFAGGDAVSGPATVILAVAAGKVAADNIDDFLGFDHKISTDITIPNPTRANYPPCGRVNLRAKQDGAIVGNFDLVSEGMTDEEARQECSRCLRCDQFGFGSFRKGRVMEW
ncbi:MAG: FAD-dependent oxidoreductase, partial [Lachnospiraceae bacterium]|nr:FAD-dependent oxidoreductase [Lachnospiraceae bacterium]